MNATAEGRLDPHIWLAEGELAECFGVSRGWILSVLPALKQTCKVTQVANQEAYLARPSLKEDRDIQRGRILLEEQIIDEIELNTEVDRCIAAEVMHKNVHFKSRPTRAWIWTRKSVFRTLFTF